MQIAVDHFTTQCLLWLAGFPELESDKRRSSALKLHYRQLSLLAFPTET